MEGYHHQAPAHRVGLPAPTLVQHHPVVHAILGLAGALERLGEQVPQEVVVGRFLKAELADIVEVDGKFLYRLARRCVSKTSGAAISPPKRTRVVLDQLGDRRALLLFSNLFVLLLVGRRLEPLPRQASAEKVEEDVAERLEVVPPCLLCACRRVISKRSSAFTCRRTPAQMGVDAHVSGGPAQALPLAVRDVLFAARSRRPISSVSPDAHARTHVFGSRYCLAMPKSTRWTTLAPFVPGRPIKKLSGLMSR